MSRTQAHEPFVEKDFYLEEFRGRSVLVALAPSVVAARADMTALAHAVADLVRNQTPVLIWWPSPAPGTERRLLAALGRARALRRRRSPGGRRPAPLVRVDAGAVQAPGPDDELRAELWTTMRQGNLCVLAVRGPVGFPLAATRLAARLRMTKVVLADPDGGLAAGTGRVSFVDENVLATLLQRGEAEWSGLGDRRELLVAVREALAAGVESVNVCAPDGVGEELFTYVGSGTLFTRGDYCKVGPLGLDEFSQAERLIERGQRDGVLKFRTPEEIASVLASGFGATVCGRHLAGVAGLLTAPYEADRAGEIAGLYTINRFKGEGLGERLVAAILAEAEKRGLDYVFACAVDQRAQAFFERVGFTRVPASAVPAAKWAGYDRKRRSRVVAFRRAIAVDAANVAAVR
jgi:amino-acid N-acetyltransferase